MGLATFSFTGIETTYSMGYSESAGFTIVMGVISGVGGGILRDMISGGVPTVLTGEGQLQFGAAPNLYPNSIRITGFCICKTPLEKKTDLLFDKGFFK